VRLVTEANRARIYVDDGGEYHEVRLMSQLFQRPIEKATYESQDPADKALIEKWYRALRADMAAFFAEHDEHEPIGEPERAVGVGKNLRVRLPGWPGGVPAVVLLVEQGFWPPAPEEEA